MNSQKIQGRKYLWQLTHGEQKEIARLASTYHLSLPIIKTLVNRGYTTEEQIQSFLFTDESVIGNPSLLKDAQKAVDRIIYAIANQEKILVAGDYDVDGISSTALVMLCLIHAGAQVNFFLPHRLRHGYGLSTEVVERAAQNDYSVIITVDNGITAFQAGKKASEVGVDLIITDHHQAHEEIPEAYAIINPCQKDCEYPTDFLAGVGVAFKVMSLLYQKLGKDLPERVYELLLFGTVADVVPLKGENRFWVRHSLQYVNKEETPALRVLKNNARCLKPHISSLDIGYSLAPQLNALGRLEDPRDGVKFFIGEDAAQTERIGRVLYELNQARRELEKKIVEEVIEKIEKGEIDIQGKRVIMASSSSWQPGVIGLAASRIMNAYRRPTFLFHETPEGLLKGSCRSIPEFNVFEALSEMSDLFVSFGGHAVAAGMALHKKDFNTFLTSMEQLLQERLTEDDLRHKLSVDASVSLADVTQKLAADLKLLEPFGCQNDRPVFNIREVTLVEKPTLLKEAHVKCRIFAEGVIKPLIFFNRPDIYEELIQRGEESFHVVAYVTENYWNGRFSVELQGIDIAY